MFATSNNGALPMLSKHQTHSVRKTARCTQCGAMRYVLRNTQKNASGRMCHQRQNLRIQNNKTSEFSRVVTVTNTPPFCLDLPTLSAPRVALLAKALMQLESWHWLSLVLPSPTDIMSSIKFYRFVPSQHYFVAHVSQCLHCSSVVFLCLANCAPTDTISESFDVVAISCLAVLLSPFPLKPHRVTALS